MNSLSRQLTIFNRPVTVHLASTEEHVQVLSSRLLEERPVFVGFDTETTVNRPDRDHTVSLISIATFTDVYLLSVYSLFHRQCPSSLQKLLTSPQILKVGVNITADVERVSASYAFKSSLRGYLDISYIATTIGIPSTSLDSLGHRYITSYSGKDPLGHGGNWDGFLDDSQIFYGASDALSSLLIYSGMLHLTLPKPKNTTRDDEDEEQLSSWVVNILNIAVSDRTFDSLVNQIVNSYGPWRNIYVEAERRQRAQESLKKLISASRLPYDASRRLFPLQSKESERDSKKEPNFDDIFTFFSSDFIGMKKKSALNKLINSYGPWSNESMGTRHDWAELALNSFWRQGKIIFVGPSQIIHLRDCDSLSE